MNGMIDVHCHILPGVDDGAKTMNEALKILRTEYEQGVRSVILTPHYRMKYFETSRRIIRERFRELENNLKNVGIYVDIYLGCEYHRQNDMVNVIRSDSAYTMADSDYILVEFSESDDEADINRYINDLVIHGFRPIVAHAERYPAVRNLRRIEHLIKSGAYIQINAASILGYEGFRQKSFCKKLLKEGYAHLIGSDAHDLRRRPPCMGDCETYLINKIGKDETWRLMTGNPGRILNNEYIS